MRVHCQTQDLLDAVDLVAGVVATNATRPILSSLLLRAEATGVTVQATDLEVGLSVRVDAVEIMEEGDAAIPAARLHMILRELRDPATRIESNSSGQIVITSGKSDFKIAAEPAEEFPVVDFKPPSPSIRVSREPFLHALRRASIAAARDATRYQMHSVLLDQSGTTLRLVSTDGKRMAIAECDFVSDNRAGAQEAQHIVPLKGVELLLRILASEGVPEVELHLDDKEITYNSDRLSLSCRLVEGRYPPYERAVPQSWDYSYDFDVGMLHGGVRQAALMITKETNSVRFSFEGDRLVLSTHASAVGESRIEVPVEPVETRGDPLEINFNPQYLLDLCKVLEAPRLRGHFKDGKTAGLFTLQGENGSYRHIVMPLVTND
ncbi:MAG: DNA polymerase III subunit beta [Planctomycetes bacterium]|nr:DNA polymerase III subunit beta [Planctomycetota bacterium]